MKQMKMMVLVLLFVLLVVIGIQNIEPLTGKYVTLQLNLFFSKWETKPIPLGFVAPICFLAGVFLMGLIDFSTLFRLRREIKQLRRDSGAYTGREPNYLSEDSSGGDSETEDLSA